jgi:hypothetical protein
MRRPPLMRESEKEKGRMQKPNKIMKRPFLCLLTSALCLCAGCLSLNHDYPKTAITGYIDGKPFSFEAPKDYDVEGFDASVDTNGGLHLHFDKLTASLNVTNINAVATGQAQIVSATAAAINQAVQNGVNIAAQAAAAAAK